MRNIIRQHQIPLFFFAALSLGLSGWVFVLTQDKAQFQARLVEARARLQPMKADSAFRAVYERKNAGGTLARPDMFQAFCASERLTDPFVIFCVRGIACGSCYGSEIERLHGLAREGIKVVLCAAADVALRVRNCSI